MDLDELETQNPHIDVLDELYDYCNGKSMIFGTSDRFVEVLKREPGLEEKTKKEIIQYLYLYFQFLEREESTRQLWNLLTNEEKEMFRLDIKNIQD